MSASIDQAFITQFEAEVHMAYQRQGSKLKNLIRVVNGVSGESVKFQKVGTGEATTKARHAEVVAMNISHTNVTATLADYYASDYVDKLDELKTNIDERAVIANNAAYALGRKTDSIITTAMESATKVANNAGANGTTSLATDMNVAKFKDMQAKFGTDDVPDDDQRYWAIGPEQWGDLLAEDNWSNLDYIGPGQLPFAGMNYTAKRFLGFLTFVHSGLETSGSTDRHTIAWHKSSMGLGVGSEVRTEVNYIPEKVANLLTSYLSMGSILIDTNGIKIQKCAE
jgi:hypothetical protein|tara:strand:+ start:411 stop:1259 length:849 start_codon:yes stop_codon:yes gene_type:complete